MKTKKSNTLTIALLVVVILLAALVVGMIWFFTSHFFVGGNAYPKKAEFLNLRDQDITLSEYDQIREAAPSCEIDWKVPFQGAAYNQDITELTLTTLTEKDLPVFAYFTDLKTVDASGCRDYAALLQLKEAYPQLQIFFAIGDEKVSVDATEVTLTSISLEQAVLLENLPMLKKVNAEDCTDYAALVALQQAKPELEINGTVTVDSGAVTIEDPDVAALAAQMGDMASVNAVELVFSGAEQGTESLGVLVDANPGVSFHWEKEVFGTVYDSAAEEIDLSAVEAESVDAVKQAMTYFPNAAKVIVNSGTIDNDAMAAFRDEMRPEYKVVWTVQCGEIAVRTDETYFMPLKHKVYYFFDEDIENLKYCEDMICIDVGHMSMSHVNWVANMPHLKYLVMGMCGNLKDISALSNCKELVFLELLNTSIKDYTPIQGCTALEDLNLGFTYADPEPIMEMTWLKNLWFIGRMSIKSKLVQALPDTYVFISNTDSATRGGWRKLPNYYAMRDALGMHYMD